MAGWELFFALLGIALALIPWTLSELGVKVRRPVLVGGLIAGTVSLVGAIVFPLLIAGYKRWFAPQTYVYLFPGRGLGENSAQAPRELIPRRAFVLQQVGQEVLHNVRITLQDNHAMGQVSADHVETYPEIDPGESDQQNTQPKHFWFAPSTPWNEDYTVTIQSREKSMVERILVTGLSPPTPPGTSANPPPPPKVVPSSGDGPLSPDMGKVELAVRVIENGSNVPLFTCQDPDLQNHTESREWESDQPEPCAQHSSEIPRFEGGLDPKPFALIFPSGMIDMTPNRSSALSSHPETEPSVRALSDWQKQQIEAQLSKFPGKKILILAAGDSSTSRYARDFRDVFRQSRWIVRGPVAAPKLSCTPTDVSFWTWKSDFGNERPHVIAVQKALEDAGVKGGRHHNCVLEHPDILVLWIGPKSPDEIKDDALRLCPPESSSEVEKLASRFLGS
jgi:hypothetical protein